MPSFKCPRCRAEVSKSATNCPACGRPIAPVPWLQRIRGIGRHSPDAQVVDYARVVFPARVGLILFLWLVVTIGGGSAAWKMREANLAHPALQQRVLEAMELQGVTGDARDGVQMILQWEMNSRELVFLACQLIAALGLLGIIAEVWSFLVVRRLVAAEPETPEKA